VGPGAKGETLHHVLDHVEAVRRDEALWELRGSLHSVDAVGMDLTPQVVMPDQVPAATCTTRPVRVDLTGQAAVVQAAPGAGLVPPPPGPPRARAERMAGRRKLPTYRRLPPGGARVGTLSR